MLLGASLSLDMLTNGQVYGGLRWTTTTGNTENTSLWHFWGETIANLDPDIVPVGAQEMARLAHESVIAQNVNARF